ncbi:reactive intermediate/imine deaminase [Desulfobotulus alkaliphilus]|uniref:Reactive intermediate/imine deaminase n=1 Tax=Desulfobotulus alkaliphilus TaxID=622671 RepID=A0A562S413_9BACT|nr:Rid family detoxifying hydrolase [Desulfobotulus alkaliphilus]TWI75674.1 reactive intermediate/imine deaminase [Desulfobotulus alkaliphilus]
MNKNLSVEAVSTAKAPAPIGPYSQGVVAGGLLFVSGQIPLHPETGLFVEGGIAEHTSQCMKNIAAIAKAAGTDLGRAVKLTIFLLDMKDFPVVNDVYAGFFEGPPPARAVVQVAGLPKNATIEIEAVIAM